MGEMFTTAELRGRPCPKCGRKTMRVAPHPHAFGWKDSTKAECWSCHARFTKKSTTPADAGRGSNG